MSKHGPTQVHPQNPLYSVDTGHGYWVSENGGVMITLNKKFMSDESIIECIESGNMSVLIYAITDRVINDKGEKGGRITFTLPQQLFCKRATAKEIEDNIADRPGLPEHITQRAPGKNFVLVLDPDLPMDKKVRAVKRLLDKPLIVSLIFIEQPTTRRICFKVMAPTEWIISQKFD